MASRVPLGRPARSSADRRPGPLRVRAVLLTRFGSPEVRDVVDLRDPLPRDGGQLSEGNSAGIDRADSHHDLS